MISTLRESRRLLHQLMDEDMRAQMRAIETEMHRLVRHRSLAAMTDNEVDAYFVLWDKWLELPAVVRRAALFHPAARRSSGPLAENRAV